MFPTTFLRACAKMSQYTTEREWDARLMIERSKAIKSPSIHYHLGGTKKVQQELARDGVLERFVKDEEERTAIKSMFTGLYPLDKVTVIFVRLYMCNLVRVEIFVTTGAQESYRNSPYP